jgi:Concanavalin A-like lectin/glucanases superfamily
MGSVTCGSTVAPNAWTHVAMTYDGSTIRLYLNGTLAQTGGGSLAVANLSAYQLGAPFVRSEGHQTGSTQTAHAAGVS